MLKKLKSKLWEYKEFHKKKIEAHQMFPRLPAEVVDYFFKNREMVACLSLLNHLSSINQRLHPPLIVEFGCGITTLVIARTMAANQYLTTIDESLHFLNLTAKHIGPCDNITFINPTSAHEPLNFKCLLDQNLFTKPADLLLIDGPTGNRFTANAKQLYAQLVTPATLCIIDDTDREAIEQSARWLSELKNLTKIDMTDPLFPNQKYAILFPKKLNHAEYL